MKSILKKYSHAWVLLYFFIYLPWFLWLEKTVVTDYTNVGSRFDELIPFCELFVIPYFLWFAYIAVTIAYFSFTSKQDFYKCCAFLFIGIICLTIYTILAKRAKPSSYQLYKGQPVNRYRKETLLYRYGNQCMP